MKRTLDIKSGAVPFSERVTLLTAMLTDFPDHARKRLDMLKADPRGAESRAAIKQLMELLPTVRGELETLTAEPKNGVSLDRQWLNDLCAFRAEIELAEMC